MLLLLLQPPLRLSRRRLGPRQRRPQLLALLLVPLAPVGKFWANECESWKVSCSTIIESFHFGDSLQLQWLSDTVARTVMEWQVSQYMMSQ